MSRFWGVAARIALLLSLGLAFAWSLAALWISGPMVFRPLVHRPWSLPSEGRLRADVERLCFGFGPRDSEHAGNLRAAAAWIADELAGVGFAVALQDYDTPAGPFRNVVARRKGTDPAAATVIVGAHYDAVRGSPGADDNASGIAVLLELARTLPRQSRRPLTLVAFSTEEPPFFGTESMGSVAFVRELLGSDTRVELMIALDCVGYFDTANGSQSFPSPAIGLFYPDEADFIAIVGDAAAGSWIREVKRGILSVGSIPVQSIRAPEWLAPVDLSDHRSFRAKGLPGVLLTDTAPFRNPHYHTENDLPATLDYSRMAALVLALHGVVSHPDDAPPTP